MAQESIDSARRRYAIPAWSEWFFDVDDRGRLIARPEGARDDSDRSNGSSDGSNDDKPYGDAVALTEIAEQARSQGLRLPLLVRFPDILRRRAEDLRGAFCGAIEATDYSGGYTSVYPVKVNQQASVVGTLASVSKRHSIRVRARGWQSGTRSAVRFAPMIAAIRAIPSTSPLLCPPASISRSVSGCILMRPCASATRSLSSFAPTSTICASPARLKWVSSLTLAREVGQQ